MTRVAEPGGAESGHAWFEVDRLDVLDSGQLLLTGYWSGIRGRRFVRPTLTLLADGGRHRLLAAIDDKPWAAEEGQSWRARFPWELAGAAVSNVELTVATDIVIPLPAPGAGGGPAGQPERSEPHSPEASRLRRTLRDRGNQLNREQRESERLREELRVAEKQAVDAAAALARRDSAISKLDEVTAERDRAVAMAKEASAARDHALSERDSAFRARDAALVERDRAATELATAKRDLRSVLDRSEALAQEARRLQAERDQGLVERVRVAESARPVPLARDVLSERRSAPLTSQPAPAITRIPDGPPAQPSRVQIPVLSAPVRRHRDLSMRSAGGLSRIVALVLLVAVVLALALVLHVL